MLQYFSLNGISSLSIRGNCVHTNNLDNCTYSILFQEYLDLSIATECNTFEEDGSDQIREKCKLPKMCIKFQNHNTQNIFECH